MTCLLGDTETRTVFDNFELKNIDSDAMDTSHLLYQNYLEHHFFLPPSAVVPSRYFSHMCDNLLPVTPSTTLDKGLFNVFPLSLTSLEGRRAAQSTLGVVSSSPLKLELEFAPVLAETWFLAVTFLYTNRIDFTGNRLKQDVIFDHV